MAKSKQDTAAAKSDDADNEKAKSKGLLSRLMPGKTEQQTVFDNPEAFEPLTTDIALWAAYRAQRAVARAMADDQDAECLSFEQCDTMSFLVRKSPKCTDAALLKHLELCGKATDLGRIKAECLASQFRTSLLAVDGYLVEIAALMEQPAKVKPPKIPDDESTLQLVDEPLALSETAKKLKRKAS